MITSSEGEVFDVELEVDILKENQRLADENKRRLDSKGVHAIDVMGSVGSGKTSLIKAMVSQTQEERTDCGNRRRRHDHNRLRPNRRRGSAHGASEHRQGMPS